MDFRLKVFATAAHTLNYSRTAQQLGISQPSVSTHIKLLEKELGVQLFSRQGKGFVLTYSGELLLQKAEKILSLYDELHQEAALMSNVTERSLAIEIPKAIYFGIFPDFAADWCRLSPKSTIHHIAQDTSASRETPQKQADAVISASINIGGENHFFTDTLLAVTPSRIKEDQYYDIAETKLLLYEGDPETSADITALISAAGLNPQTLTVSATMKDPVSAIKFLVEYGKGSAIASTPLVCFLWKSQVGELLRKGTLKTISLTEMSETPAVRRNYNLYPGNAPGGKDAFAGLMEFARGWAKKKLLV